MWNTCAWTAEGQRDWIKSTLGPTLEAAGMRHLKLMVLDHNRDALPWYPATVSIFCGFLDILVDLCIIN